MIILKVLYVCWVSFFAFLWFILPALPHHENRVGEFLVMLGLDIAPLLVYSLCCFAIKRDKKYLIMFFVLFAYYPLGYIIDSVYYFGFEGFFNRVLFFTYKTFMGD